MPRGVYDRTKTKEQRAAEKKSGGAPKKAAKAAAAPKKHGRKASAKASAGPATTKTTSVDREFTLMNEVRVNLATLTNVADKFGALPGVKTEIEAHVQLMGTLRQQIFGNEETETTVSNGTTAQPAYQAPAVPLPPTPTIAAPPAPTH